MAHASDPHLRLASLLLRQFGPAFEPIAESMRMTTGMSEAEVFRIRCGAGDFAVRRWPEECDPMRIRAMHRLLAALKPHGIPVAVPQPNRAGRTLINESGHLWQVEPWLPGECDTQSPPSAARVRAAFRQVAAFHIAAEHCARHDSEFRSKLPGESKSFGESRSFADYFPPPDSGPAPAIGDRATLLQRLLRGELFELIRWQDPRSADRFSDLARRFLAACEPRVPELAEQLQAVRSISVPRLPCLRDLRCEHLLFTGETVTGLIDPAALRTDTVATDLSRLLIDWFGLPSERWTAALAAYEEMRPLTPNERRLIPLLAHSGVLLSGLHWIRACRRQPALARQEIILDRLTWWCERIDPASQKAAGDLFEAAVRGQREDEGETTAGPGR